MLPPLSDLEGRPRELGQHARNAVNKLRELGMEDDVDKSVTSLINLLQPIAHQQPSLAAALLSLTEIRDVFEVQEASGLGSISEGELTEPMDIRSRASNSQGGNFVRPPTSEVMATGGGEEWSPPPLSKGSIWGGGPMRPRTPAGLVMEAATMSQLLSSTGRGGSKNTSDTSIFEIEALPSQEADRERAVAVAALGDGKSSEAAAPPEWLRVPRNLPSASADLRFQGSPGESAAATPACAQVGGEFQWSFEDPCSVDAAANYNCR